MLKKGLAGIDLRHQVVVIGFLYTILALFGIVYGFLLLENPEAFTNRPIVKPRDTATESEIFPDEESNQGSNAVVAITLPSVLSNLEDDTAQEKESLTNVKDNDQNKLDDDSSVEGIPSEMEEFPDYKLNRMKRDDESEIQEYSKEELSEEQDEEEGFDDNLDDHKNQIDPDQQDSNNPAESEEQADSEGKTDSDHQVDSESQSDSEDLDDSANRIATVSHYYQLVRYIQNEGLEAMIACLLKLVCSITLIAGARNSRPWFLLPWLVEESVEMVGGLIQVFITRIPLTTWDNAGELLLLAALYSLAGYCIYSVYSYFFLIRRMRKQSEEVISSLSQGGFQSGMNYQRLEDDTWNIDPNLAREFRDLGNRSAPSGFVRESKLVVEEDQDDHVLYVK